MSRRILDGTVEDPTTRPAEASTQPFRETSFSGTPYMADDGRRAIAWDSSKACLRAVSARRCYNVWSSYQYLERVDSDIARMIRWPLGV
ncbi:predicted protein [Histoplasma mississippiense (nom. inval.)]|uniref:predicted protein n=1 Tax=Ajellomyces capsulatus (strain NAm1 / WU24) TaxID=2059318 RepID=UPI000157C5E5|nr:predicted protein [Histoplasma mississippiense (nom. inval.)]EDN08299.1 predicted protein [Histoplasma mississippiense (nom. inval.)]